MTLRRARVLLALACALLCIAPHACRATNWHCFYTNCLYVFAPPVYDGRTVDAARVSYGLRSRADTFGPLTNTDVRVTREAELTRGEDGFSAYVRLGGEQHRLWDWRPFDVAVFATTSLLFADGTRTSLPSRTYWLTGRKSADRVIRCAPRRPAQRYEDREADAARSLDDALDRHAQSHGRTNDLFFISFWGYTS